MNTTLIDLFGTEKPVIGMVHLERILGETVVQTAMDEIAIYASSGIKGVIVEDYHGTISDVNDVLKALQQENPGVTVGVNILRAPHEGFLRSTTHPISFVQYDNVHMQGRELETYEALRRRFPQIKVLGGVGFKYQPLTGRTTQEDLEEGMRRCDAIVTTGEGTGIETPTEKLLLYKQHLGEFPLIIGAGVNQHNIREQLSIADGAIIGSAFKPGKDTRQKVRKDLVMKVMEQQDN